MSPACRARSAAARTRRSGSRRGRVEPGDGGVQLDRQAGEVVALGELEGLDGDARASSGAISIRLWACTSSARSAVGGLLRSSSTASRRGLRAASRWRR